MLDFGQLLIRARRITYSPAIKKTSLRCCEKVGDKKTSTRTSSYHHEDAAKFVAKLKGKKGKGICLFGGGELAKSFLKSRPYRRSRTEYYIQSCRLWRSPLHEMKRQIDLEFLDCKILKGGYWWLPIG